eukprot:937596_1
MDLTEYIDVINVLNTDDDKSSISPLELVTKEQFDNSSFIVSEIDEELLVLIKFKQMIDLHSIKLYAFPNDDDEMSPLEQIHIYKVDNLSVDFDDVQSMEFNKTIKKRDYTCSMEKLKRGQFINIKAGTNAFNKVACLAMHITSNQSEAEVYLNGIKLKGLPNKNSENKIIFEPKEVITSFDLPSTWKNNRFKNRDILFDDTDTQNKRIVEEIEKQFDDSALLENINGIYSRYLLYQYPNHTNTEEKQDNDRDDEKKTNTQSMLSEEQSEGPIKDQRQKPKSCDNNNDNDEKQCPLAECTAMNNLIVVMKKYHAFINDHKNGSHIKSDECNLISILNDFHHLLDHHSLQFEAIFNILTQNSNGGAICTLRECAMVRRNRRDRALCTDKYLEELYGNYDVAMQQVMDSIHCYYFHSFDSGYKLCEKDKNQILALAMTEDANNTTQIRQRTDDPLRRCLDQFVNQRMSLRRNSSKFTSHLKETQMNYNFGLRLFYWDYYKTQVGTIDPVWMDRTDSHHDVTNPGYLLQDLYVASKYQNLKQELTQNGICTLSTAKWENHVRKASKHAQTDTFKAMKCTATFSFMPFVEENKCYGGITKESSITLPHIIAMMVHCNEDGLNAKFSASCRMSKDGDVVAFVRKHSNYAHLGRLLREFVDLFGTHFDSKIPLYSGIDAHMEFTSANTRIKGPFSATTVYAVARGFADVHGNDGMILELYVPYQWLCGSNSYSCQYLTDYTSEQEVFFIGGTQRFTFLNISEVSSGVSYKLYVKALSNIDRYLAPYGMVKMLSYDKHIHDMDSALIDQVAFRMLAHEINRHFPDQQRPFDNMPKYAEDLLRSHFSNITQIAFGGYTEEFNQTNIYMRLFKGLLWYDYGWIKLDLLSKIFPNLMHVRMMGFTTSNAKLITCPSVFTSMLNFLGKNKEVKLETIYISLNEPELENAKQIIKPYEAKFKQQNWSLYVNPKGRGMGGTGIIFESFFSEWRKQSIREYFNRTGMLPGTILKTKKID